jgi:cysteine sulfinate desulfinase/cysteine desulfurase-like protein
MMLLLPVLPKQERGLRSGTLPHPLAVGFGAAAEIASREMAADTLHIKARWQSSSSCMPDVYTSA